MHGSCQLIILLVKFSFQSLEQDNLSLETIHCNRPFFELIQIIIMMIDDEINQPGENARPVFYEGGQPPSPQTPLSTAPIASPSTKREII